MAYRADIEIAVRGAQQLKRLKDEIAATSKLADGLNNYLENIGAGGVVRSINNLQRTVSQAAQAFDSAALGTKEATLAAKNYAAATRQLNAGLEERVALLKEVNEQERVAKLARSGIRERTQYSGPIGPGPASAIGTLAGQKSPVEERIRRTIQQRQEERALEQGLLRLEEQSAKRLNEQINFRQSLVSLQANMVAGAKEVLEVIDKQNQKLAEQERRSKFLAGKSGALQQGPLAPAGAMGFPVAVPLSKAEQEGQARAAALQERRDALFQKRQARLLGFNQERIQGQKKFNDLKTKETTLQLQLRKLDQAAVELSIDKINGEKALTAENERQIKLKEQQLKMDLSIARARSSPIEGGLDMPGSPKFLRAQRRRERLSGVALGAGFPLLFGGGPGAVLGGAAGGLVGGPAGFAAQIALSAIGQQVDKFVAEVAKTGVALTSAAGTFELVKDKSLFSSEEVKKLAYALEEQGKVQELATLLTTDLAKQIGSQGVLALQDAGKETKEFTRLVNLLFTQLSAFVAGPLADFLSFINQALGSLATNVQFGSFKESLKGGDVAKFAAIEREVRGTRKKNIRGGKTQDVLGTLTTEKQTEIIKRATAAGLAPKVTGLTTFEDTQTIRPPKGRTGKSAAEREAEREAKRVAKALIDQRAVTLEIQRQSEFSAKIAAAELAKDPVLVRRLQGEQQLAELGVQVAKQLELEKNTSVQLAIAKGAQAKADLIRQETAQEIAQIEQRRQEQFDDTLAALTYQVEYESAVTREKREQLELEEEIRKAKGQGFTPEQVNKIAEQTKRRQAQQRPLQKYMTDLEKSLNDTEGKVVQLAQTIENELSGAMSSAITGIITGTTTVEEAFSQMFLNIGKAFIDMATQMLAQQLILSILKGVIGGAGGGGGGLPGFQMEGTLAGEGVFTGAGPYKFADGGYPPVGQASLVGENGPELFVPGRQGTIVPNDIFAATRAALNSGGTASSAAFDDNAQALAVSSSYTRERVMERERQTMLTGAGGSMVIQTEVINNVEYATVDQVAQAAAASAKQARAQVFADMRNKPSTRTSLGMR